ncbi:MAG: HAMP domain-containing sensor histidine kinase [Chloroflexota bacterium]
MQSPSTSDVYRRALKQAQPLAGVLSVDSLLRRLIQITQSLSNGHAVRVHLVDRHGKLRLQAYGDADLEVHLVDEPSMDDALRLSSEHYIEAGRLYVPMTHSQLVMGMVSMDVGEDAAADMALVMETACTFAAAGLVNARTVNENATIDVSHIIERTRLAAMNELAAAASHQLNNPLTTIMADTEILLLKKEKGSSDYDTLKAISRAGQRAAEVVRRLMAVSQPDRMNGIPQQVDVVQSIDNVLVVLRQYIRAESIQIHTTYPEEDRPHVHIRPDALGDVWLNILMNARDAVITRDVGQIHILVQLTPEEDTVNVQIWDNGVGIAEHEIRSIFEPFYTTRSPAERMGLGLHTSKRIVESVGGSIRIEPWESQGTRVIVSLPVMKGGK